VRFRHDFLLLLTVVCLLPVAAIPEPAPISVEALFKNPSFDQPRLSPDGTRVALAISLGDDQIVAVRPLSGGDAQPIVRVSHDEIRLKWLRWGNDETVLISGTMRDARSVGVRGRASRLFSVPATGGKLTWLGRRWPEHGQGAYRVAYQDRIAHNLPGEKGHVLVEYQNPIKDVGLSIQRMNVRTGALRGYQPRRDDIWHWGIDKAAVVRVGVGYTHDNHYFVIARPDADSDWEEIIKFPLWQDGGPTFAGFTPDPNVLYVHAPHEGRQALFEWDIRINELGKLVFAHDRVDAEGVVYGEDESVIGVRYIDDTPKIRFLDRETGRLFLSLNRAIRKSHGSQVQIELVSESQDHRFRIFEVSGPTQPPIFYIHDQEAKGLAVLLVSRPDVDTQHLSAPRAISYEARDGRTIEGYLTLPRGGGEEKLPLIVMPHGGPWARDWMRWDPEVQLFASRGYAVFQPNFRGSEGFGDDLLHAGYREWGYAIQDDITDGTNWLVEEGIADPHRIGIYGGSFGAFASLMGLVKTPDLYSAGAGYAGCYDIEDMVNDDQWYQWWDDDWHEKMIGADPERLRTASPRRRANEIRAPVLLAHGQDDQRLNANQSRDMHEALKKAGKQVEYMEFENEIHGFLFERNKIAFYSRLIEFFDEHLAPRAQPEKLGGN
jgi:dipeptidyl aminopeptidase/acylaminoacyl peptidase